MNKQFVEGMKSSDKTVDKQCEACALGKMKETHFLSKVRTEQPNHLRKLIATSAVL